MARGPSILQQIALPLLLGRVTMSLPSQASGQLEGNCPRLNLKMASKVAFGLRCATKVGNMGILARDLV